MIQVTSREFRERQAALLNMADQGEQVIIRRRGGKCSYMLTPVHDNELSVSPELEKKIEKARKEYKNRETIVCKNAKEAIKFLESL